MSKTYPHPDYTNLSVIEAQTSSDQPSPGCFFVTHQNVSLSHIATKAYGTPQPPSTMLTIVKRINRSKYNMQKCFYRYRSDDCYSSRVASSGALTTNTWGPGAWLSLCNADKGGTDGLGLELGTKYQVIWIPTVDGKEPWEIGSPTVNMPNLPTVPKLPEFGNILQPSNPALPGVDIDIGIKLDKPEDDQPVETQPKKAGVGWWLAAILGAGAVVTTIVILAGGDKKKGKRGKK